MPFKHYAKGLCITKKFKKQTGKKQVKYIFQAVAIYVQNLKEGPKKIPQFNKCIYESHKK